MAGATGWSGGGHHHGGAAHVQYKPKPHCGKHESGRHSGRYHKKKLLAFVLAIYCKKLHCWKSYAASSRSGAWHDHRGCHLRSHGDDD